MKSLRTLKREVLRLLIRRVNALTNRIVALSGADICPDAGPENPGHCSCWGSGSSRPCCGCGGVWPRSG